MSELIGRLRRHPLWVVLGAVAAVCLWLALGGGTQADSAASSEEKRIAEVLSAMAGAGKVEVALHYGEAASAFGGTASAKPSGAVVVAEGAGELNVRLSLIRAMRTLLGLPESAVDVFEMKEAGQ